MFNDLGYSDGKTHAMEDHSMGLNTAEIAGSLKSNQFFSETYKAGYADFVKNGR